MVKLLEMVNLQRLRKSLKKDKPKLIRKSKMKIVSSLGRENKIRKMNRKMP